MQLTKKTMEKEKLLQEHEATLNSLIEKSRFIYSAKFYELDDLDKQKYQKDKMATEAHLGSLCDILWGSKFSVRGGLSDVFAFGLLSSMFGGGCGWGSSSLPNIESLSQKIESTSGNVGS